MTPQEAVKARRDLRKTILRADRLAARCLHITCDGDLPMVDRGTGEKRFHIALKAAQDLEGQLVRLNEVLER